jgi:hypothetical protein
MLMSGATMSLASMLAILDPAIEHVLSQGLYRDQSLVLLVDCLELLPFSDDPAGGIARVEVLDKFEHRPYQFRDVITAMGYTRSEAAVPLLLKIARGKSGLQSIETPWLESLGRLNTDTSRRTLLSFIDPDTLRRRQSRLRPSQRGNLCGVRRRRGTRGFRTQAEASRLKRGQTDRNPTETPSRHLWRARLFRYDGS